MSTPFTNEYLKVVTATSDVPVNPVDGDEDTSPEMIAFCFDAETQTLSMWDPVNEERLTISLGGVGTVDAEDVTYDNGASGLVATDVQAAIDELAAGGSGPATTDDLTEGATNKYFTDERAQDAVGLMVDASLIYVDGTPLLQRAALTGDVTASAGSNSTTIASGAVDPAHLSFTPLGQWIDGASPTGTGVVTFNSIPSTFRHLLLVYTARSSAGSTPGVNLFLTMNNDTGANYDRCLQQLQQTTNGNNNGDAEANIRVGFVPWSGATAGYAGSGQVLFPNYKDTGNLFKTAVIQHGEVGNGTIGTTYVVSYGHGVWRNSADAVSRLDLTLEAGNFAAGSRFDLYGLN